MGPVGQGDGCPQQASGTAAPGDHSRREPGNTHPISHPSPMPAPHWLSPNGYPPRVWQADTSRDVGCRGRPTLRWPMGAPHRSPDAALLWVRAPCCNRDLPEEKPGSSLRGPNWRMPGGECGLSLTATPADPVSELPDAWPSSPCCPAGRPPSRCGSTSQHCHSGCVCVQDLRASVCLKISTSVLGWLRACSLTGEPRAGLLTCGAPDLQACVLPSGTFDIGRRRW